MVADEADGRDDDVVVPGVPDRGQDVLDRWREPRHACAGVVALEGELKLREPGLLRNQGRGIAQLLFVVGTASHRDRQAVRREHHRGVFCAVHGAAQPRRHRCDEAGVVVARTQFVEAWRIR